MKSWKEGVIPIQTSLEQALHILNYNGLRILLIVDEAGNLKGTLTDGDLRRAILKRLDLNAKVTTTMNPSPIVGLDDWSIEKSKMKMGEHGLLHLPIVSDTGKLLNLISFRDVQDEQFLDCPVLIMAGGRGQRLMPMTENCPKPMLKIAGKPILEIILDRFLEQGFKNFYLSVHYLENQIKEYFGNGEKWNAQIQYIHEAKPLGTAGALSLLPEGVINKHLIVTNGDIITSLNYHDLLKFFYLQKSDATVCVRKFDYTVPFGVVESDGVSAKAIIEKPVNTFLVNAGIYVLDHQVLNFLIKDEYLDMPNLLSDAISRGKKITVFEVDGEWTDVGSKDDLKMVTQMYDV